MTEGNFVDYVKIIYFHFFVKFLLNFLIQLKNTRSKWNEKVVEGDDERANSNRFSLSVSSSITTKTRATYDNVKCHFESHHYHHLHHHYHQHQQQHQQLWHHHCHPGHLPLNPRITVQLFTSLNDCIHV